MKQISFRISEKEYKELKILLIKEDSNFTEFFKKVIQEYLKDKGKK